MAQGPQGLRGPQGAKGDKGDLGATGSRGLTGQNGLPGHGAGPVFMAYNSAAQNIASGSSIMNLIYSTATANTGNYYNTATGVFTPLVAGFYQVNASIYPTGGDYFGSFFLGIYKNGSPISMGSAVAVQPGWGQPGASSATVLVYLNDEDYQLDWGGNIVFERTETIPPIYGNVAILDFKEGNCIHEVKKVVDGYGRFAILSFVSLGQPTNTPDYY